MTDSPEIPDSSVIKENLTTDLVRRLRSENSMPPYYGAPKLQVEAAAEIERLRAANETWASAYHAEYYANERLRSALKLFACDCAENDLCKFPHACRHYVARAALDGQPAPGKEE